MKLITYALIIQFFISCWPKTNIVTIDDFMARCRNQANKCKFRDSQEIEDRLIEQLVIGTKHKRFQERLSEKGDTLTLDIAI